MMHEKIKGTGVALATPFLENGEVDFESLHRLTEHVIQNGADFIVALGTTGETPTLSDLEKHQIAAAIVSTTRQRLPIVLGLGGNCTADACQAFHRWNLEGIHAILSVVPYYSKPSQEGIYQHFKQISENSPLPLILYNVPSRTSVNIDADTVVRLAIDCKNIAGIKEASGNINQITEIIQSVPDNFVVLSGDDFTTLPLLCLGGQGVISVIANALPLHTARLVKHALAGELKQAQELHFAMHALSKLIFQQGNPAGIKSLLAHMELCANRLRLPLTPVSDELSQLISQEADRIISHS